MLFSDVQAYGARRSPLSLSFAGPIDRRADLHGSEVEDWTRAIFQTVSDVPYPRTLNEAREFVKKYRRYSVHARPGDASFSSDGSVPPKATRKK